MPSLDSDLSDEEEYQDKKNNRRNKNNFLDLLQN